MAVRISGFQAVSNDLDLFREQLQDGLTVKEQLNAVTLHLNKLKLKYSVMSIRQQCLEKALQSQVWLCDTENAIGNGKNVSGLKNTVKLQLGKYEWMSEDMTSKKKQLVELLETHCVEIRPFNGLGSRYKVALKIRSETMEDTFKYSLVFHSLQAETWSEDELQSGVMNDFVSRYQRPSAAASEGSTPAGARPRLTKSIVRQRALNAWLKILTHAADWSKQLDLENYSKKCYL
ncbi:hypothetical protein T05_13545 [Trichinella murrelli]|uniref:Uncharacterized protein n=1 Tax=Trichinella murrelli TaxID=144512 RepID=A0A0V0TP90_9BILA|nr:hypothetical protein T05_13545 [Trichinella murrelli]